MEAVHCGLHQRRHVAVHLLLGIVHPEHLVKFPSLLSTAVSGHGDAVLCWECNANRVFSELPHFFHVEWPERSSWGQFTFGQTAVVRGRESAMPMIFVTVPWSTEYTNISSELLQLVKQPPPLP
jgi:hypothetical protein